ncbi:hypothetical protein EZS27_000651 [termite gut metagenome]|uniref:Secretin/TonB short N-terminal domain-containing protein n=1 Tax=termite gut metagenome TaxID=433724 RepID=A0A5J4T0N7_9ZZZZ
MRFIHIYSDDLSFIEKKVSVNAVNRTVESILDAVLKNSNLTYQIEDNGLIIIVPNHPKESEITGKITNVNGEGMPGVNVVIKGSRTGVVSDINKLDEIVVIGYGTVKKRDLTGAVSSVKAGDLNTTAAVSIGHALQLPATIRELISSWVVLITEWYLCWWLFKKKLFFKL